MTHQQLCQEFDLLAHAAEDRMEPQDVEEIKARIVASVGPVDWYCTHGNWAPRSEDVRRQYLYAVSIHRVVHSRKHHFTSPPRIAQSGEVV